ncbi:MAG TPA: FAD:protein FMN transferase [Solirubrobacteraceae bacterium]|jgi:thiamine biosynthesis lipoprotein|nr:FAD:protein FMN transferase [Solirubrobacteraceae bacterium]
MSTVEAIERFDCFGCSCGVLVIGDGPAGRAAQAARRARASMLEWHHGFSRFLPDSELSRLNRDVRRRVPVSPMMARLVEIARHAASLTDGLVDATLLGQLERAGYREDLHGSVDLQHALSEAPARIPAAGSVERAWEQLELDPDGPAVIRPPGLQLDSGGLAKGLFADVLAQTLSDHEAFAVDCGGDLAIGGSSGLVRPIEVQSPLDGSVLHRYELARTGVATSGIGRRSWLGENGRLAHHLLDPHNGRPAYTGVIQATALAPSATLAEIHAKAAVLSGPAGATRWLPWGGVIVFDDGSHRVVEAGRQRSAGMIANDPPPRGVTARKCRSSNESTRVVL